MIRAEAQRGVGRESGNVPGVVWTGAWGGLAEGSLVGPVARKEPEPVVDGKACFTIREPKQTPSTVPGTYWFHLLKDFFFSAL